MEFVTEGKLYQRNGAVYVVYEESEISGMDGCKTTLRLKDDTVRMKRTGMSGYGSELYFEKGKRFTGVYSTPFGDMSIEVLTSAVSSYINAEEGTGRVDVSYDVSMEGVAEGKNQITIDII